MRHSYATCCVRARARKLGARLAKEGGERQRVRRNIKALLGNEVPCFGAGAGGGGEGGNKYQQAPPQRIALWDS